MRTLRVGLAAVLLAATMTVTENQARAQCTTCSPLSLPSGSLVGQNLEAARRSNWAILTQATTGWVAFPRQVAENRPIETFERARFDLFLTTLQATALHKSGLGVDVVAPFGFLQSRTGDERRTEFSFGDVELRPRATTLVGRSVRLSGLVGAAFPTGSYTARSGAGALGDASRALTIGRGVYWGIAEAEARWEPVARLALTLTGGGRVPLSEAADGFRWAPEARGATDIEVRPWRSLGLALGGEVQYRGNGSIIDPFLNQRIASENVGATIVSLTPAVRVDLPSRVFFSVSGRLPVYQDLVGLQFQQGPGVFAGLGYVFPVGHGKAAAEPSAAPGEASIEAPRFVVREYGAEWCAGCKRLEPLLETERARRHDVRFERIDVTDWSQDELARRVPQASLLPIVEVLRADGSVVVRLEGDNAFSFAKYLEEKPQ